MAIKEVIRANIMSFSRKRHTSKAVLNNNIDSALTLRVSKTIENNNNKRGSIFL